MPAEPLASPELWSKAAPTYVDWPLRNLSPFAAAETDLVQLGSKPGGA